VTAYCRQNVDIHRRTLQITYPSRLLMATAVISALLTLLLWWLGLQDARRRAFPVADACAWNSLPSAIDDTPSLVIPEPPEDMAF